MKKLKTSFFQTDGISSEIFNLHNDISDVFTIYIVYLFSQDENENKFHLVWGNSYNEMYDFTYALLFSYIYTF